MVDRDEQKQNSLIYVNAADLAYGRVVRALGRTVTPFWFRVLFTWLPRTFIVHYRRRFFSTEIGDYVFGRHARAASTEIREEANDCRTLLKKRISRLLHCTGFMARSTPMQATIEPKKPGEPGPHLYRADALCNRFRRGGR
jgi:hypothetical protein